MIVTALLGIGFIFALAGDFVLWEKLDEQRKATAEEYNRRWDEISLRLNVEKEKDAEIESLGYLLQAEKRTSERMLEARCKLEVGYERVSKRNSDLQDRLSALLCPHNDHVWRDGVCVKCGKVEDE